MAAAEPRQSATNTTQGGLLGMDHDLLGHIFGRRVVLFKAGGVRLTSWNVISEGRRIGRRVKPTVVKWVDPYPSYVFLMSFFPFPSCILRGFWFFVWGAMNGAAGYLPTLLLRSIGCAVGEQEEGASTGSFRARIRAARNLPVLDYRKQGKLRVTLRPLV